MPRRAIPRVRLNLLNRLRIVDSERCLRAINLVVLKPTLAHNIMLCAALTEDVSPRRMMQRFKPDYHSCVYANHSDNLKGRPVSPWAYPNTELNSFTLVVLDGTRGTRRYPEYFLCHMSPAVRAAASTALKICARV